MKLRFKGKEAQWDPIREQTYKPCPKCGGKAYITIEPFEGSYFYCQKCKKDFGFKGIC